MYNHYIVVEGIEGSGKTTICNVVLESLKEFGKDRILLTREPGGTLLAEKIRNLLLDNKCSNEVFHKKSEVLMFYAARVQLIETVIKPALSDGKWIISDRNELSSLAYQGGGRLINQKFLKILHDTTVGDCFPGLILYLDVIPEIGLKRTLSSKHADRLEKESIEFFNRVRSYYLELASKHKDIIRTINAMKPLQEVIYTVRDVVTFWLKEQK